MRYPTAPFPLRRPACRVLAVLALITAPLLLAACEPEPDYALRVGRLGFTGPEVTGFTAEQLATLADVAGLGQLATAGEADSMAAPLAEHAAELARLEVWPLQLAAREQGLDEAGLRAAYAADPAPELRVRHVVRLVPAGASDAERAEARRIVEQVQRRAAAGEPFAQLAAAFSEEPGAAERGGLLEPGRRGTWVDPFWEAASALEPGEVSPVVETPYGYHVLRLEERRPIPFEQAGQAEVLRRVVDEDDAERALQRWAEEQPAVLLDPPAVLAARQRLPAGEVPDTLELGMTPDGYRYTGRELTLRWAQLEPEQRAELREGGDLSFARWLENEAERWIWSREAARMGVQPPAGVEAAERERWATQLGRWAGALGFAPGMEPEVVRGAALSAVGGGSQEARIARAELRALRGLLRDRYPVSVPESEPSSSEMRSSESTR